MDWWTEVRLAMATFLDQHGLVAAFVFLLIEEAGVPVPVPGDFLMLILGVRARQGDVSLWQAIAVMEAATLLGATFLYAAARLAGRSLVYRYGRFVRLSPERLDRAERWLKEHGSRAVFLGRLVPGLRIVTAVACGVFSVPVWVFVPAMAVGALLYIGVYTLLGYFLGPPVLVTLEGLHLPFGLLGQLIPLGLIIWWTVRARQALHRKRASGPLPSGEFEREQRLRAGAVAGLLATIASTLLINVVVNLAGNLAFQTPDTIVEQTAGRLAIALATEIQPLALFLAVPAFLIVGVLWGALYGLVDPHWSRPEVPDWLTGVVFALAPLLVSLVLVMPLLGLGFLGVGATGPVALVGETIRHGTYGVLLGLMYPILRARRNVRVRAHSSAEVPPVQAVESQAG
jgi:membrane protein DedA with SNARE-associated domain